MIRTWVADISALEDDKIYQTYYEKLPRHRKAKADRLKFQKDKAQSAGVWILFQKMQQAYHLPEDVLYNLSHSGSYVLCSVNDGGKSVKRLGCDLEEIKEPRLQVAKRFFCESEYQKVLGNPELFYRYWVLKESFMKATRLGMELGMDQFEFAFTDADVPYLKVQPEAFPETYYFQEYILEEIPCRIAVCSDCREIAQKIKWIKIE